MIKTYAFKMEEESVESILNKFGVEGKNTSEKLRNLMEKLLQINVNNIETDVVKLHSDEFPSECFYRTVKDDYVYCDTKKIPKEVCVNRQRRFLFMGYKCRPIIKEMGKTKKKAKEKEESTYMEGRNYKGYVEGLDRKFPNVWF